MPAINIEDLSEKDKLKMEVEQLRKEVKLERQPVSGHGEGARSCPAGGGAGCGAGSSSPLLPGRCGTGSSSPLLPGRCGSSGGGQEHVGRRGRGGGAEGAARPYSPGCFGTAAVCTDRSCRHFGSGAGAVGTAPLTPRRSAGPSRGSPWDPGEGAHHLG